MTTTLTMPIQTPTVKRRVVDRSAHDLARRLVADYLRDWGLCDPDVLASECRRIVAIAEGRLLAVHRQIEQRQLCETVIRISVTEVENSSSRLLAQCRTRDGLVEAPATLAPRLRAVLREFPTATIQRERLPAKALSALRGAAFPIVPRVSRSEMGQPVRPRLFTALRRGYWRRATRHAVALVARPLALTRKSQ